MASTKAPTRRLTNGRFETAPSDPNTLVAELTTRQDAGNRFANSAAVSSAFLWANGGTCHNPMGFPGYEKLYGPTDVNYRFMLQHPILRLVRFVSLAPILSSTWNYEKARKNVPDEWVLKASETFNPLRLKFLRHAVRGMDYGTAVGEPIWTYRDGMYWLSRVKELSLENTRVLRDVKGNVVGLRQYPSYSYYYDELLETSEARRRALGLSSRKDAAEAERLPDEVDLPYPYKAWHWAYDAENESPYGRSWLENCRQTAWKDWLDTMQQMQKTGAKISGIVSIVMSPSGTFPDGVGGTASYKDNATTVIKALSEGAAGVWLPSIGLAPDARGNIDAMKVLSELVGKSLTTIDVKDFGNHSAAITGFLDRLRHAEELMFASRGRSPRVAMEGKSGTKADATTHTDTSITVAELEDQELAESAQPLLDADMVLNFGERARGSVRIRPPSISMRKTDLFRTLLLAGLNDPAVTNELFSTVNVDLMLKSLDIDVTKPFSPEAMKEFVKSKIEATTPNGKPEAKSGGPSGTGLRKGKEK